MQGPSPYDRDAEDALVGDMLATPAVIPDIAEQVTSDDIYQPRARAAFAALIEAHRGGDPLGPAGLAEVLTEAGLPPDPGWIVGTQQIRDGAWRRHARTVVANRVRRQVIALAKATLTDATEPGIDPSDVLDQLRAGLGHIHIPDGSPPAELHQLDEFLDRTEHDKEPWLIPGLLRRGWRVVVVAGEGHGKSTLWRQFAICAAQGLHPLGFEKCMPMRTLLVDLENPVDAITEGCLPIRAQAQRTLRYEPGRAWLWHRPEGIDLRTRAHQTQFASVLAATRPDVVCLGPLYKCFERSSRETDEQAVAEVQRVFDDLRTRFGFALLLEHHAPQDTGFGRKMRPYGSSLWLRWPEIGIGMEYDKEKGVTELRRWRRDRMVSMWPEYLERGQTWPWIGTWNDDSWRTLA